MPIDGCYVTVAWVWLSDVFNHVITPLACFGSGVGGREEILFRNLMWDSDVS